MASRPPASPQTWPGAAHVLAQRVNRRTRRAAALHRVGWTLLAAALVAVLWRALGGTSGGTPPRVMVGALLALGILASIWPAWRAMRSIRPVSEGDAAWALDRLADAGGRGLAAAATEGPAASEAAHAGGGIAPPPALRLLPPRGLLPIVGAGLLAAVALLAPERSGQDTGSAEAPQSQGGTAQGGASGAALEDGDGRPGDSVAAEADLEARTLQARAEATEAVRQALGLAPEGPVDASELEARLQDPALREAARKAAAEAASDGARADDLADALDDDSPSAESLARILAQSEDHRSLATERRRAAVRARAGLDHMPLPPSRRRVVERYLALRDRR